MNKVFPKIAGGILLAGFLVFVIVTATTSSGYTASKMWFILLIAAGFAIAFAVRLLWRAWADNRRSDTRESD